jgi:dipeptidyl aminopeptidase/acylaminoacyl peptidase
MWKPFALDRDKKYPLILYVYPGPQSEQVPVTFGQGLMNNNMTLAQLGFVVIHFGIRGGSYQRPLAYSRYGENNMRDYPVDDLRTTVEQMIERYKFIDRDRVGIYGVSSGGYETVTAMCKLPHLFKVGVAVSGLHDPRIYEKWWNDMFNGVSRLENEQGEVHWTSNVAQGNMELVSELQGQLLIMQGECDPNVHPAHAARLVDALMAAGKRFDYLLIPGKDHGWSRHPNYELFMTWSYFARHLMGDERGDVNLYTP